MEQLRQFGLLMWKHIHLRKHRWFMTLIEILLPIFAAYVFCSEGSKYMDVPSPAPASIEPAHSSSNILEHAQHFSIFYAPKNDFTDKLFGRISSSIIKKFKNVEGVENEDELVNLIGTTESFGSGARIGVVFSNIENNTSKPSKMSYKIRNANMWSTELLFTDRETPGPHGEDSYFYQGFAGVQMAVDTAFIQLWKTDYSFQNIQFQAFPYPEYSKLSKVKISVPKFICFIVILTSFILAVPLISNIIEEKESGVKELMKLVGVEEWLVQVSWFANAIIFSLFSYSIAAYFFQKDFGGPGSAVFSNVPVMIIWICIILYCVSSIAFCFTFSAIFHSLTVATSVFTLVFCLLAYGALHITSLNSSFLIRLACIFPLVAFYQGFERIGFFENHEIPISWSSLNEVEEEGKGVSLQFVFLMLIFDTFLYLLLTYYITCINPGTFGSRRSPLFFLENLKFLRQIYLSFQKILWPSAQTVFAEELVNMGDSEEAKYFETPPKTLKIGINIQNLYKNFGSFHAVRGLNLKVYKGEITALLGHNGAGKTTSMSILTGMLDPTAGSITYNGDIDVLKQMREFRQYLGLCPQEDRLFPYLTVVNHLLFFGMLKGASRKEAQNEAENYLDYMEMMEKANDYAESLSGGMKRKLCLAISLMGGVETLILDEPTSGMDVESRRKVWDLLLELRGDRTIILTTHHMEEADVLGDRIAIMHNGTVVCHGTTMFLKKVYGSGYKLTITKEMGNESVLTNIITDAIPGVGIKESDSGSEIIFNLPLTESAKFSGLFRALEAQQSSLGIENIGVSCTTMEQVFLKVGGISIYDVGRRRSSTVTDGKLLSKYSKGKKTGSSLILQQLLALFLKKFLYTKRNIINFCYRILLPSIFLLLLLFLVDAFLKEEKPINLTLSTYPNAKVMLTNRGNNPTNLYSGILNYIQNNGGSVIFVNRTDIIDDLLDYGRDHLGSFQRELLLAATFDSSKNLTLYNKFALHSLPVLINTLSNVQLGLISGGKSVIETINSPMLIVESTCDVGDQYSMEIVLWFIALAFYSIDVCYYFSTFLSMERNNGFKHIQLMSNVSPLVYWFSNFIFDCVFVFVIIFLRIVSFKLIDDSSGFLSFSYPFPIFLLLFGSFVASGLLFLYVFNFLSGSEQGSYTLLFVFNIVGCIITVIYFFVEKILDGSKISSGGESNILIFVYYSFKYVIHLLPPLNYSLAFLKFARIRFGNISASKPACVASGMGVFKSYLEFSSPSNSDGILLEVIFMMVDIILYAALLAIIEAGYLSILFNKILMRIYGESVRDDDTEIDPDVEKEREKVHSYSSHPSVDNERTVLLAQDLKKVFVGRTLRPFVAVEDMNFTVNAGECFGLLGVNGAGKSTTFKMLTGIFLPTKGDSSIQNIRLSQKKTNYLSKSGYCAQTNCFIEELTGQEMLNLIASLRGIGPEQRKVVVDKWLSILSLESFQDRKCGRYSGGNKRKLCTAMSLIGDPNVVFLDEPTTGVDPVSRRKLYDVMEYSKLSGQAVVLTSHSMEECENLCDRITIMTKGRMRCIGTAQHLKQRYAQGFSILIKTVDIPEEKEEETLLSSLKNIMEGLFGEEYCILKDEHKGLLYYQITNVDLKWSQLFEKMENLKNSNDMVEDYTVSDTTLEEVFISFAQE